MWHTTHGYGRYAGGKAGRSVAHQPRPTTGAGRRECVAGVAYMFEVEFKQLQYNRSNGYAYLLHDIVDGATTKHYKVLYVSFA